MANEEDAKEMAKELKAEKYEDVEFKWTKRISMGDMEAADEEHLKEKVSDKLYEDESLREEEVDTWIEVNGERVEFYP